MLLVVLGHNFFENNSYGFPSYVSKALEIRNKDVEKLSHIKTHMYWLRKMTAIEKEGRQICLIFCPWIRSIGL